MRRDGDRFSSRFSSGVLPKFMGCASVIEVHHADLRDAEDPYLLLLTVLKGVSSQVFEVGLGGFEFGEEAFFRLELAGVDAASAGFDADGMFEVEHLVIEEIFDCAARRVGPIEDARD